MKYRQTLSFQKQMTFTTLVKIILDPVIIIGMLFGISFYLGEPVDRNLLILSLLIFALTFPGSWTKDEGLWAETKSIMTSWPLLVGVVLFFGYATGYLQMFARDLVIGWVLITPVVMLVAHLTIRALLYEFRRSKYLMRTAVIVGAGELGYQLRQRIQGQVLENIEFKGFFEDRRDGRIKLAPEEFDQILGRIDELAEYIKHHSIDLIYVALPMSSQPRILKLLDDLKDTTGSIYFVPDIFMFDLIQARIDDVGGLPVVAVCESPFNGLNAFVKRISDVVLASIILVMISPILLLVATMVKFDSPGPILFKQRRYGLDGQEIVVYKFRSMTVCEDGQQVTQATKNDSRVTAFGRFIRKTSLDELPQFINVLQGQMSIVGPRPHAVAHNEMYRKLIKGYMIRHKVKPGITGWAQINGLRGGTETVDKMEARIEYDLDYLRNWSLWLDLKIIFRTVVLVFKDAEAY